MRTCVYMVRRMNVGRPKEREKSVQKNRRNDWRCKEVTEGTCGGRKGFTMEKQKQKRCQGTKGKKHPDVLNKKIMHVPANTIATSRKSSPQQKRIHPGAGSTVVHVGDLIKGGGSRRVAARFVGVGARPTPLQPGQNTRCRWGCFFLFLFLESLSCGHSTRQQNTWHGVVDIDVPRQISKSQEHSS